MHKLVMVSIMVLLIPGLAFSGFEREPVFGLDIPVYHWGWRADRDFFGAPCPGRLGAAVDAVNLRIPSTPDTTDIILVADMANWQIHWLRCPAIPSPRPLQFIDTYGSPGDGIGQFKDIEALAVAKIGPYYNPQNDHIFAADRLNHRIVKLSFDFSPESPSSDRIIWQSATYIDDSFYPCDLQYIDFGTGNRNDNRLLALDDNLSKLDIFSDGGDFITQYDLTPPSDTILRVYNAFDYKINPNGIIIIYALDRGNNAIRRYRLRPDRLDFINEIYLGTTDSVVVNGITYIPNLGPVAVDFLGPRFYLLADNLSGIIRMIGDDNFNPRLTFNPSKIKVFPERIVVFEETNDESGIVTIAFERQLPRESPQSPASLPYSFSLDQNYPNPFNPNTMIRFSLPEKSHVKLQVFDVLGRLVRVLADDEFDAGFHELVWDGKNTKGADVSSGAYFYKLSTEDKLMAKRMILLK